MTIGETVRKAIKEISDSILGLMMPKDFKLTEESEPVSTTKSTVDAGYGTVSTPKRARTKKGKYKADNKKTKNVNQK